MVNFSIALVACEKSSIAILLLDPFVRVPERIVGIRSGRCPAGLT